MSSPRTQTAAKTVDSTEKPKGAGLSPVQIAAGALAAVSSAVLLSFFGVAGTLTGAALASVISTVGASLYSTSLNKTNERLRRALTTRPAAEPVAAAEAATQVLPAHLDPRRAPAKGRRPRWSRVAVYAVAVFVVAMGIVTGIELISQKPVSALVGHSSSTGTTLSELTNVSSHTDTTPTTPSSPTTTAPATSTSESTPTEPTETSGDGSSSASRSTTSSTSTTSSAGSSSARSTSSSAAPTRSTASTSQTPAQSAAPTP
jgi:hypothetical protein